MIKKVLSVMLLTVGIILSSQFVGVSSVSYANTSTYPLANITVYRLFANLGYEIDTNPGPYSMTNDGFPIYATALPDSPLVNRNVNTLVITDKSGSKILGIQLFLNRTGYSERSQAPAIKFLLKIIKAIDENYYNKMDSKQLGYRMVELLCNGEQTLFHESIDHVYNLKTTYTDGERVMKIEIEAAAR